LEESESSSLPSGSVLLPRLLFTLDIVLFSCKFQKGRKRRRARKQTVRSLTPSLPTTPSLLLLLPFLLSPLSFCFPLSFFYGNVLHLPYVRPLRNDPASSSARPPCLAEEEEKMRFLSNPHIASSGLELELIERIYYQVLDRSPEITWDDIGALQYACSAVASGPGRYPYVCLYPCHCLCFSLSLPQSLLSWYFSLSLFPSVCGLILGCIFTHTAGLRQAKRLVQEIAVLPLQRPELFTGYLSLSLLRCTPMRLVWRS
jgi:ABC-type sugar transport system permease subunit